MGGLRDSAPEVVDYGPAEAALTISTGTPSTSPRSGRTPTRAFPEGLPGDSCQCPHWGYMITTRLTVRYGDHEEVIEPGDAFYMCPFRGGSLAVAVQLRASSRPGVST